MVINLGQIESAYATSYGPSYSLWYTATYWKKTAYFPHRSLIRRQRDRCLCSRWNFVAKLTVRKL